MSRQLMADIFSPLPINVWFPFFTFYDRFEVWRVTIHDCIRMNTTCTNVHTYVCSKYSWALKALYHFVFCFSFSVVIFIVLYVASFLLASWTDGMKYFYFYFRFRSSYFIDGTGSGTYSSSTWNCNQLEIVNYELRMKHVRVFISFIILTITMNYMKVIHVVRCYTFFFFRKRKTGACVCASLV